MDAVVEVDHETKDKLKIGDPTGRGGQNKLQVAIAGLISRRGRKPVDKGSKQSLIMGNGPVFAD